MKFLKVPKAQGEKIRQKLTEKAIFAAEYPILSEGSYLLFPVNGPYGDFEIVERAAEKRELPFLKLKDALADLLDENELQNLTTSFDLIGDIAILEIPESLSPKEKQIGEALLKVHKNIKTVLKKLGPMEGEYRVRRLRFIAGEDKTETTYREHNCLMRFDVSKVYFSIRLSTERKRISDLVKAQERILVLFAGVGPFALVIAKDHPDADITAVELNPDAVASMKENIILNKFPNISVLSGDARAFNYGDFDRVIMPLPHSADKFLDLAFSAAKPGGIIHFYTLADSKNPLEDAKSKIKTNYEISSWRIVRPYSADIVQVVLDLVKPK
ncbi:MAG: class I SAM-dependent methyltransferase family protein [Candidatus Micrarchaeota archaeon]